MEVIEELAIPAAEMRSEKLRELISTLEAMRNYKTYNRARYFTPYPKQQDFLDMGSFKYERLLSAGNQYGKSETGAFEAYVHSTGDYPDWWLGHRFEAPTKGWIGGETGLTVRDVCQKKLLGEPGVAEMFGTGMIPKDRIIDTSLARGVSDAIDTVQVRHASGGISIIKFKTYEQGRAKWASETLNWIWYDEEPPSDIYTEGQARLRATLGRSWMTFTPLLGMSTVAKRFFLEKDINRGIIRMDIDDALHIPESERERIIRETPAHERDARIKGLPHLGSGRIFPYADEAVMEAMISTVPPQWFKLWGIDFGIDHPFGAVLIAWDKDADVIHILHCIRVADQKPLQHAAAMKLVGAGVPVAWPQDGHVRDKGTLEPIARQYGAQGLYVLPEHATWPEGGNSTEAGVLEMQQRIETGRLKVASHLSDWFEEFRMYHRKDGMIVKTDDDLLSATRVAIMMKRMARAVPLGTGKLNRREPGLAKGVDFDVFG